MFRKPVLQKGARMRDEIDTSKARQVSEGKKSGFRRAARVRMKGFTGDETFVCRPS